MIFVFGYPLIRLPPQRTTELIASKCNMRLVQNAAHYIAWIHESNRESLIIFPFPSQCSTFHKDFIGNIFMCFHLFLLETNTLWKSPHIAIFRRWRVARETATFPLDIIHRTISHSGNLQRKLFFIRNCIAANFILALTIPSKCWKWNFWIRSNFSLNSRQCGCHTKSHSSLNLSVNN